MGDVNPSPGEGIAVAWGHSVLEPTRGHVREVHEGRPVTDDVRGAVVGMALCGALLIDDLHPAIAAGEFDTCSVCLQRLDELRRNAANRPGTQDPSD